VRKALTPSRLTLAIAGGAAVVDQLTKYWAQSVLSDGSIVVVPGVLSLRLGANTGAAFGILRGAGTLLGLVALVAIGMILYVSTGSARTVDLAALGLILGGTIGNLADRVVRGTGFFDGAVVDWIQLPNWPTFNLADAAIVTGAALLVLGASLRRS
jgi:signal peptidase II